MREVIKYKTFICGDVEKIDYNYWFATTIDQTSGFYPTKKEAKQYLRDWAKENIELIKNDPLNS